MESCCRSHLCQLHLYSFFFFYKTLLRFLCFFEYLFILGFFFFLVLDLYWLLIATSNSFIARRFPTLDPRIWSIDGGLFGLCPGFDHGLGGVVIRFTETLEQVAAAGDVPLDGGSQGQLGSGKGQRSGAFLREECRSATAAIAVAAHFQKCSWFRGWLLSIQGHFVGRNSNVVNSR